MRKLRLDLETLTVESFSPVAKTAPVRGTVHGLDSGAFTDMGCGGSAGTTLDTVPSYGDTGGCTCPREVAGW